MWRQLHRGIHIVAIVVSTVGFQVFQKQIPNGDRVTNPCDNLTWNGVGHLNKDGGGERNVFGKVSKQP